MQSKMMKKSFRASAVVSLMFLAQCCCCILPVGYQVQQGEAPNVRRIVERIETFYQEVTASLEGSALIK